MIRRLPMTIDTLPFWARCAIVAAAGLHALFPALAYLIWYARLFGIDLAPQAAP